MNALLDIRPDEPAFSAELGFLSPDGVDERALPRELDSTREAAQVLPRMLVTGRIRHLLSELPLVDLTDFCGTASEALRKQAMVHYAFLVQAYVWGEPDAPQVLPANLAVPVWQLSRSLGQPPLLTYSNYVLDNWGRFESAGPIDLANVFMKQSFLGGQDEAWFVLIHVVIEAQAAPMIAQIPTLMLAERQLNEPQLLKSLAVVAKAWDNMNATFDRMPERCDPYVYFNRVRPWIHGWKDNPALKSGLVYEGVEDAAGQPQVYRGQTGAQSSIMPTMDALFGIGHADDPLKTYLDDLHHYRPPTHRAFIEYVQGESKLRAAALHLGSAEIKESYNQCILNANRFRTRHLEYAASYINKQSRGSDGNTPDVGTGGTPFMKYLKKHRDETEKHLL